jgi:TPR repeat protein
MGIALTLYGCITAGPETRSEAKAPSSSAGDSAALAKEPKRLPMCYPRAPETCLPGCNAGDAHACFLAGEGFNHLSDFQQDITRARAAYERGCKLRSMEACTTLGIFFEDGTAGPKDLDEAMALYERACAGEMAVACRNVGRLCEGDAGYPPNLEKARSAYQRGLKLALNQCALGRAHPCMVAGYMLEDGQGADRDEARGTELVAKACKLGYPWACKPREPPP